MRFISLVQRSAPLTNETNPNITAFAVHFDSTVGVSGAKFAAQHDVIIRIQYTVQIHCNCIQFPFRLVVRLFVYLCNAARHGRAAQPLGAAESVCASVLDHSKTVLSPLRRRFRIVSLCVSAMCHRRTSSDLTFSAAVSSVSHMIVVHSEAFSISSVAKSLSRDCRFGSSRGANIEVRKRFY